MSFHTNPRLLAFVPTAVFVGLSAIIAVVPAVELNMKYESQADARLMPDEVAATVRWLCSAGAGAVNGQAIAVCGGETM